MESRVEQVERTCFNCGAPLADIHAELTCPQCHRIDSGCCEGSPCRVEVHAVTANQYAPTYR